MAPLAALYGLAVRWRNGLFDRGWLSAERFAVPVICVGNLAVGGTGKTPHTEYLLRLLAPHYRVAVLSRGYKRRTSGFRWVTPDCSFAEVGDEALQMARKFPEVMVAVDGNRRRGIRNLLASPEGQRPEVIVLDDGFQHRYVTPSLAILLTDYSRLFQHDRLLPVGRLREPVAESHRADVVIVTKCPAALSPADRQQVEREMSLSAHQRLFFTEVAYGALEAVFPEVAPRRTLESIGPEDEVLLCSGIASPRPFVDKISAYGGKVTHIAFADHAPFTRHAFRQLEAAVNRMASPNKLLIVTEKDVMRLLHNPHLPKQWQAFLYYLPVSVHFSREAEKDFNHIILQHIRSFSSNTDI
jgi:tetraacyldisaccharide 4'-kinase